MDDDKRRMRKLKRAVKKHGQKSLRQRLSRDLRENPEEAHHAEADFDRDSSATLNGMDFDRTRRGANRDSDQQS